MKIAPGIGATLPTIEDENQNGSKLLLVRETEPYGKPTGAPFIAVDTVGAGTGDLGMVVTGSSARNTPIAKDSPVDGTLVGVIDSLEESGQVTFRMS